MSCRTSARRWLRPWRAILRATTSPLSWRPPSSGRSRLQAPIAAVHDLPVHSDERLIEAGNIFEGKTFGVGDGALTQPSVWRHLVNPLRPSWGEPYTVIATRMLAAIDDALVAAAGPRGGADLPPVAGVDGAKQAGGQAPVARPAAAANARSPR